MSDDDREVERAARRRYRRRISTTTQSREEQLALNKKLSDLRDELYERAPDMINGKADVLDLIQRQKPLSDQVVHVNEFGLDVEIVHKITNVCRQKCEIVRSSLRDRVTCEMLIEALNERYDYHVDWSVIGQKSGLRTVKSCGMMGDCIEIEIPHLRKRRSGTDMTMTTQATQLQHQNIAETTEERVAQLLKILRAKGETGYNMLILIVNPHDFGQTIENTFDLSVLVSQGHAKIFKRYQGQRNSDLYVAFDQPPQMETGRNGEPIMVDFLQSLVSFDMRIYQEIIEVYDIRSSIIPHRRPAKPHMRSVEERRLEWAQRKGVEYNTPQSG